MVSLPLSIFCLLSCSNNVLVLLNRKFLLGYITNMVWWANEWRHCFNPRLILWKFNLTLWVISSTNIQKEQNHFSVIYSIVCSCDIPRSTSEFSILQVPSYLAIYVEQCQTIIIHLFQCFYISILCFHIYSIRISQIITCL